ncbi:MAG TPA: glycoside hydrolase family 88 protein [Ohtaekwangia sp.]|uniref:glycoside hydrolase family 88 protein n=1 Tax=Ohtaekwangia sp. TaxID=2066019 RepID=UPI002F95FCA4
MNARKIILVLFIASAFAFAARVKLDVAKDFETIARQLTNSLKTHTDVTRFPRSTKPDGSLHAVPSRDWTSGFYAGNLWYMYDYSKDKKWEEAARQWTAGLENEKFNTHTHDLGFILFCSFGNGYRLTQDPAYKDILLQGARSLSKRFNPKTGTIRSWDHGKWQYPVIIDNMMNLELLFWATAMSGDSSFYKIAVTHANTTLKNHFRADNSSYHVVDYDTLTGKVIARVTHQGYADESAWARGQAWGLYGYTTTYRATKDKRYLEQAEKIAAFILHHPNLPKDKIPYWDYNAQIPNEERDVSAAAITASALLELGGYAKNGEPYRKAAEEILINLSTPQYLAKVGTNNNFILMHSVGHKPAKSEIDVPIIYADYYYIEGLLRYDRLKKKK